MGFWKETKTGLRKWKFKYTYFTKKKPIRKVSKIRANQYAIKTGKDKYRLILKGRKRKTRKWF